MQQVIAYSFTSSLLIYWVLIMEIRKLREQWTLVKPVIVDTVKLRSLRRSSYCGSAAMNLTSIHEDVDLIPGPLSELRIQHFQEQWCSHRCGSDLALLWLWCRPAAIAPNRPLAQEPPCVAGVAQKDI